MYSLVIAEDEFTTRRGLVNMVRWKELGFQVDGEFSDGRELLDYLKGNTPDVILTDIRMTQVGGMEIARFVAQQNLPVQVVFLSGHKEFALAQEAVTHHVYHYLLKPVDLSRLRDVFRSLKEKLDQMSRREELVQDRLEHYNRLVDYERQQFVTDAYFGSLAHPEQMARRLRLLGAGDQAGDIRLFLVKLVLEKDSQYQDFLDNYGTQELQEQLLHVLAYFDRNLEYYPITWGSTKEGEMSLLGVFWETKAGETDRYQPCRLREAVYDLLAIRARVEQFLHLDAPEDLVRCTKQVGMEESAGHLMEEGSTYSLSRTRTGCCVPICARMTWNRGWNWWRLCVVTI